MASWHGDEDDAIFERLHHRVSVRRQFRLSKGKGHRIEARIYAAKIRRASQKGTA